MAAHSLRPTSDLIVGRFAFGGRCCFSFRAPTPIMSHVIETSGSGIWSSMMMECQCERLDSIRMGGLCLEHPTNVILDSGQTALRHLSGTNSVRYYRRSSRDCGMKFREDEMDAPNNRCNQRLCRDALQIHWRGLRSLIRRG